MPPPSKRNPDNPAPSQVLGKRKRTRSAVPSTPHAEAHAVSTPQPVRTRSDLPISKKRAATSGSHPARRASVSLPSVLAKQPTRTAKTTPADPTHDEDHHAKIGKHLAIDCEMLQTKTSSKTLGRVSIVDYENAIVLDTFVQPPTGAEIVDYRTRYSGLSPALIASGRPFEQVREEVERLIRGRVLIGHAIGNEFAALQLRHPRRLVRDTQLGKAYKQLTGGKHPGLKKCAKLALGLEIQVGPHDSVEDARATMLLYKLHRAEIDSEQGC